MSSSETATIIVAEDFSKFPFGRTIAVHGPNSGEAFRDRILKNKLSHYERIKVILDGADGYSSSFLEEAFGGLIRTLHWNVKDFTSRIVIISESDPSLIAEINQYVSDAAAEGR